MQNKYYIAIDIGGTKIKFGVFDNHKKLIDVFSIDTVIKKTNSEQNLINYIFDSIDNYCEFNKDAFNNTVFDKVKAKNKGNYHTGDLDNRLIRGANKFNIKKSDIKGIGFTIPGPVVNGKVIKAVNINWKKNFDIKSAVKKRYGKNVSVVVGNDGNLAALGEYVFHLKRKVDSICMFTLGTAIGTGVIVNGKLVEGKHGIAGELSHLKVDYSKDAIRCNCGNVGCLETVAGGKAMLNMYKRMYPNDNRVLNGAIEIIKFAKNGDKKCLKVLNKSFDYLSSAIASVILTYEPEIIIIGGGVSNAGEIITKTISKQIRNKIGILKYDTKIVLSKYKNKAGLYGAVAEL